MFYVVKLRTTSVSLSSAHNFCGGLAWPLRAALAAMDLAAMADDDYALVPLRQWMADEARSLSAARKNGPH